MGQMTTAALSVAYATYAIVYDHRELIFLLALFKHYIQFL